MRSWKGKNCRQRQSKGAGRHQGQEEMPVEGFEDVLTYAMNMSQVSSVKHLHKCNTAHRWFCEIKN